VGPGLELLAPGIHVGGSAAEWLTISHPPGELQWGHISSQLNSCFILRLKGPGREGSNLDLKGAFTSVCIPGAAAQPPPSAAAQVAEAGKGQAPAAGPAPAGAAGQQLAPESSGSSGAGGQPGSSGAPPQVMHLDPLAGINGRRCSHADGRKCQQRLLLFLGCAAGPWPRHLATAPGHGTWPWHLPPPPPPRAQQAPLAAHAASGPRSRLPRHRHRSRSRSRSRGLTRASRRPFGKA
jgi:hypothetical protein